VYLYGFVNPSTGETYWLILPTVTTELMSLALHEFAIHVGAGAEHQVVLAVDQAGFHTGAVTLPEGIHLIFLPPHTPELQPAERLWNLMDEPLVNQCPQSLKEVEDMLYDRCRVVSTLQHTVRGLCQFHWWPKIVGRD
jgi:transposase